MAESKNTFLKAKMNKDLDNRLLQEGEYIDAVNISVGKSESNRVGLLQNVLGNEKVPIPEEYVITGMQCIGAYMDNNNNRVFLFFSDYNDENADEITIPTTGNMQVSVYDFNEEVYTILLSGVYLNFATNEEFTITGVSLVESLLFWTDNRNQPRKINVTRALQRPATSIYPYYINETQISVAKYSPVDSIVMYRKKTAVVLSVTGVTEMKIDVVEGITEGMTVISSTISGSEYIVVTNVVDNLDGTATITLYSAPSTPIVVDDELTFLISTMSNKSDVTDWPGDTSFLEDKYIRFSYRFKYDDNEHSIMAPFTQIAYIPKQKGYFIAGDESDAFRSTVLNWFENNVNNIELIIPLPDSGSNILETYKIKELDILYKESDSNNVKVFETIAVQTISDKSGVLNTYTQQYQSQKPYKTLPENDTTRVSDKTPVRARALESVGNRVIYGNYHDKYTPPTNIDYYVTVQPKSDIYTNFIEYPNHTVKQNRNYQVGFILSDKFGRQSPVLLSKVDLEGLLVGGITFGGSTIYSPYTASDDVDFPGVKAWFGDALLLVVNSPIVSERSMPNGTPGLYATVSGVIDDSTDGFEITYGVVDGTIFEFILQDAGSPQLNVPKIGNYLRGKYTDYVEVKRVEFVLETYIIGTDGPISDIYNYNPDNAPDVKYSYDINPIGWYSYKVVVRQQEQDYYNVYLPGMLNGYPILQTYGSQTNYPTGVVANPILENGINTSDFPVGETDKTAHIVLTNDNINKVPRDLVEVGPDQKQYRSSVQLYGRVSNTADTSVVIVGEAGVPGYPYIGNSFTYDITTNLEYALVGVGNGIQSVGANTDIPGSPPTPNPYRWYGNTVVVSNTVVGTTGTIVFSPANFLDDSDLDYRTFEIVRAENIQYFPTKKADIVSSIATATDFSFLDNSVENIVGKAALNLYQLQTNPLVGRVTTVKPIGVESVDMTPFLSVYETKPEYSLLDLFWETSTTGLISDLNVDVNTGYDGPVGFTPITYIHYENQDYTGEEPGPGDADSKYVTNAFYPRNASGISLTDTTITIISVTDGTPLSRISDFDIEQQIDGSYKLKITTNNFIFNYNANSVESYLFTLNVLDNTTDLSNILTISGRLRNIIPDFVDFPASLNITQTTEDITTFAGVNGSITEAITGLQYTIVDGDTDPSSFSLNPVTGALTLENPAIPLGVYNLTIRLTDAVNFATNPPLGTPITGSPPYYYSLYTESTVAINVGSEPVTYWVRPEYETANGGLRNSQGTNDWGPVCYIGDPTPYPNKYGIGYIGNKDIALDNGYNANLPTLPGDIFSKYQFADNIEIVNGLNNPLPAGPIDVVPQGLTQGTVKWTIELTAVQAPDTGDQFFNLNRGDIIIYYREQDAVPTAPWQVVTDDNNVGFLAVWADGVGSELDANATENNPDSPNTVIRRYTSFTTTNPSIGTRGEWAVAVRLTSTIEEGCWIQSCVIKTEDANFSYTGYPYDTPIVTAYKYQTGLELDYFGVTVSGIPWDTQDARRGIDYLSPVNRMTVIDVIDANILHITLETPNSQLVIGLNIEEQIGTPLTGYIIATNIDGNPNKIALYTFDQTYFAVGRYVVFKTGDNTDIDGTLWATTPDGTSVKRFYTDEALTQVWNPPVADKFYNFWRPERAYNVEDAEGPSENPFFSARITENGEIVELLTPDTNTVQTAWKKSPASSYVNYGRNITSIHYN